MAVLARRDLRRDAGVLLSLAACAALIWLPLHLFGRADVHAYGNVTLTTSLRVGYEAGSDHLTLSGHVAATGIPASGAVLSVHFQRIGVRDRDRGLSPSWLQLATKVNGRGNWADRVPVAALIGDSSPTLQIPSANAIAPGRYQLYVEPNAAGSEVGEFAQTDHASPTVTVNLH